MVRNIFLLMFMGCSIGHIEKVDTQEICERYKDVLYCYDETIDYRVKGIYEQ